MSLSIFQLQLIFVEVKIPVIVVFTKFDILVVEHFRVCGHIDSLCERKVEATNRALRAFNERAEELRVKFNVPFVPVSTKGEGGLFIIIVCSSKLTATPGVELTKVTRENLRDIEGSLWALWATAQQINARQKVELSIRCVFSTINYALNYDPSRIC